MTNIFSHLNLFLAILIAIFVLLLTWVIYLTILIRRYLQDKKQILKEARRKGLDKILEEHYAQLKKLGLEVKELQTISSELSKIATLSITKIGMIRYNPFGDVGGDQSFSIALLNNHDNGLVISSLHGREGTRMYAKPIEGSRSKYHLSKEEEEAIQKAQGNK